MAEPGPRLRELVIIGVLLILSAQVAQAQSISLAAIGGWSPGTAAGDLPAGAGSDLPATCESDTDAVLLDILGTVDIDDAWRVDVRRADTSWHGDLTLEVKRTGNGAGAGSVSGGTTYLAVGTSDAELFQGAGDLIDIPLQLRLGGVSVRIPPATYSTTITCTVVDIL